MKKNIAYLDLFKLIFSIFIIGIHTEVLWNAGTNINWYIKHLFFRLAVPFFFVVSGFLLGLKIINNKQVTETTKRYVKKLLVPYFFWLAVGFPLEFYSKYNGSIFLTIKLIIKELFFYPWGALWYIWALIVSISILSFFYKKNNYKLSVIIGSFLYLFALLSNSYYFVAEKNSFFKRIVDFYVSHFISSRNGIFVGLFLISIGVIIAQRYKDKCLPSIDKCKKNIIICFIIYIIELTIVKDRHYIDDNSLFITLPMIIYYLVCLVISIKSNEDYSLYRKYSVCMYLCHRPILAVMMVIFKIKYGLLCFIINLCLSFGLSKFMLNNNNEFIKKITMS